MGRSVTFCPMCSHSVDSPVHERIAIDPIPNSFHDDCEGQLIMVPSKQYKNLRVKYEKLSSESKNKWTIKRNRRKERVKISYIYVNGNCDNFQLGEEKHPNFQSIFTISTSKC